MRASRDDRERNVVDVIRVLMVSSSYPADGSDWRGLFIRHLAQALARRRDVALRLWSPPGEIPANAQYVASPEAARWLASLMAAGGIAHLIRQGGGRGLRAPFTLLRLLHRAYRATPDVDLYHVNWLQNALPLPRNGRPLLVTVLGTDMQLLKLPMMRTLLRRACRGRAVAICPNADWMQPALQHAFADVARVQCVPFGIDPGWYRVERQPATGNARWLCVSRLTAAKLGPLFEWGAGVFARGGRELHLFGPRQEDIAIPDWIHYHGPATPEQLRDDWFPQATGLLTLSAHAEGRPQVMLEAMAAGLPIVASRLPAHVDLVEDGRSGWLCDTATAFAQSLEAAENPARNLAAGQAARDWARRHIGDWDDCAARYAALYEALSRGDQG